MRTIGLVVQAMLGVLTALIVADLTRGTGRRGKPDSRLSLRVDKAEGI